jgi:hypothetical protein
VGTPAARQGEHTPPTQVWPAAQQMPLQYTTPPPQRGVQVPEPQNWSAAHTFPQDPQFCGSNWKLVQKPLGPDPQKLGVKPGHWHVPVWQLWPAPQVE